MEKRIKAYETWIAEELTKDHPAVSQPASAHKSNSRISPISCADLAAYHREMLNNFQHERSIHLAVTLFFVGLSVVFIILSCLLAMIIDSCSWFTLLPLFLITFIMTVLSIFYVKHYYFLENHVQKLYDASDKIAYLAPVKK